MSMLRRRRIAEKDTEAIGLMCTTKCNLKCSMCFNRDIPEGMQGNLSFDNFVKIIDKFPNLKRADLTGFGESLLHPHFFEMVEYLKNRNLHVSFTTSLSLFSDEIIDKTLKLNIDVLTVSLNSLKKEVSEKLKEGICFEYVTKNLAALLNKKDNLI